MYKLLVEKQGQFFIITIDNKVVKYFDKLQGKLWGGPIQYLPPDPKAAEKIRMSRNKIPADTLKLLEITQEELQEFNNARNDEELLLLIRHDLKKNNCKIIKEEKI